MEFVNFHFVFYKEIKKQINKQTKSVALRRNYVFRLGFCQSCVHGIAKLYVDLWNSTMTKRNAKTSHTLDAILSNF